MESKIISKFEELEDIREEWKELELNSDITFYDTFNFNYNWANSYKNDNSKELFVICIYDNKKIIAIMPLVIQELKKKFVKYKELNFMADADYKNVIVDKRYNINKIHNIIFDLIKRNDYRWDLLNLNHISEKSYVFKFLLKNTYYNKNLKMSMECPVIFLDKYTNYDNYKHYFSNSHVNKYRNKLLREVGYILNVVRDDSMFDSMVDTHIKEQSYMNEKYNNKDRYSIFNEKDKLNYIRDLYKKSKNTITFIIEGHDKEIIAYSTCYIYNGVLHFWNTGFNPKYEKYSVGRILKLEIIKNVFENRYGNIIDFGCGRYAWKFEWTDDFVSNYNLKIWGTSQKVKLIKGIFKLAKINRILKNKEEAI